MTSLSETGVAIVTPGIIEFPPIGSPFGDLSFSIESGGKKHDLKIAIRAVRLEDRVKNWLVGAAFVGSGREFEATIQPVAKYCVEEQRRRIVAANADRPPEAELPVQQPLNDKDLKLGLPYRLRTLMSNGAFRNLAMALEGLVCEEHKRQPSIEPNPNNPLESRLFFCCEAFARHCGAMTAAAND
jgi:hypothetical protein